MFNKFSWDIHFSKQKCYESSLNIRRYEILGNLILRDRSSTFEMRIQGATTGFLQSNL
jgi:hypothetical protein